MPFLLPQTSLATVSPEVNRKCSYALIYAYAWIYAYVCIRIIYVCIMFICVCMCLDVYMCVCVYTYYMDTHLFMYSQVQMVTPSGVPVCRQPGAFCEAPRDDFFPQGWPP